MTPGVNGSIADPAWFRPGADDTPRRFALRMIARLRDVALAAGDLALAKQLLAFEGELLEVDGSGGGLVVDLGVRRGLGAPRRPR